MNIEKAEELAKSLISKYLTSEWSFSFNRRKAVLGVCNYTTKTISLSKTVTLANSEAQVKNTILHEIAHVIAGAEAKHSAKWVQIAKSIGCDGKVHGDINTSDLTLIGVKWVCVDETGKIWKHWFRKPAKSTFDNIGTSYIPSAKAQTFGKLKIIPYK